VSSARRVQRPRGLLPESGYRYVHEPLDGGSRAECPCCAERIEGEGGEIIGCNVRAHVPPCRSLGVSEAGVVRRPANFAGSGDIKRATHGAPPDDAGHRGSRRTAGESRNKSARPSKPRCRRVQRAEPRPPAAAIVPSCRRRRRASKTLGGVHAAAWRIASRAESAPSTPGSSSSANEALHRTTPAASMTTTARALRPDSGR
jgi:hypothetical protein